MSSDTGRDFGKGPGEPYSTHGISELQSGNDSQTAKSLDPSEMLRLKTVFVRGMKLEGYGLDASRKISQKKRNRNDREKSRPKLRCEMGNGTYDDPSVFVLHVDYSQSPESLQAQNRIAQSVAKNNGFPCIVIRKGMHNRACTYDKYGRRNTFAPSDGNTHDATIQCDEHMTVWMGEGVHKIMVDGHIYLYEAIDPMTGKLVPFLMDDPINQRDKTLLQPGQELVAEEFWLVDDAWETFSK